MQPESQRITAEIAHVLFMDLVGYSTLSMEEQARLAGDLREIVRRTPEFERGEARGDLIRLDTGDGMALVFFRDPIAPIQCAVEIAAALKSRRDILLRMGIHSGPVSRMPDINGKDNVSGSGINIAQRVMDCGDEGHVLLSSRYAEDLAQFDSWSSFITDLGVCEVKHGVKLHIFNFSRDGAGNPAAPSKCHSGTAPRKGIQNSTESRSPAQVLTERETVAILYKRGVHPDEELMHIIEKKLGEAGYDIFIDRHLFIGVEWALAIENQIRKATAVVPLLSAQGVHSEMLEHEIQCAHSAAEAQGGYPRLLPIRVRFAGDLPEQLAAVLNPLNHFEWEAETDTDRLVTELLASIRAPVHTSAVFSRERLEPVGGAVPLNSHFYIVRPTDEEFRAAITRRDSIVLVKGARQMGKTSLLARGLQQARDQGARVVLTDFQTLNASHLATADTLFLTLAEMVADQLDLDTSPDEVWNPGRGPNMNLERYLRREVFGAIDQPIVWGLDEVDRLFSCDYGSEVFGLFRSWHNKRALDPSGPWSRLTLAIAYATEAHLFIKDLNQSPFNVGTRLSLEDFNLEQIAELNRRYESPLRSLADVERFHALVGGQPYLVRRGLDEMTAHGMSVDTFVALADRDEGMFGDHLRRILVTISQDAGLTEAVREVLCGRPIQSPAEFYRLRSTGILAGDSASAAVPRCQLYAAYLSRHLL